MTGDLAAHPLRDTERSKEITDRIHRLIRKFSRDLVDLVYQELGARAIVVKGKPGPKKGFKHEPQLCPLCEANMNCRRRFGFICKRCSQGKDINAPEIVAKRRQFRKNKKDRLGKNFKVEIAPPPHIPAAALKPKPVPLPDDAEPAFLDTLLEIVPEEPKEAPPEPPVSEVDEEFWS